MGSYARKLKKGVRWFYSGQYLGKKYHSRAIYRTKAECAKAERLKLQELDELSRRPFEDMPIESLMAKRLDDIQLRKSKDYYRETRRYYKRALAEWEGLMATEITKQMVNSLLAAEAGRLKKEGRTYHKANSMLRALKALFNFGYRVFDIKHNPCNLDFYPIDVNLKHIPPDKDIEAVRAELDEGQLFLFDFVDQTACRINEAVRFRYSDIEENGIILWTRKSRNSNLTPRRLTFIPACLEGRTGKGKVFNYSALPRFLERKIAKLGLTVFSWHNLRHRRASIWASEGRDVFWVQQMLGHQNITITMRYLQLISLKTG